MDAGPSPCPRCGARTVPGLSFCSTCGARLRGGLAAIPGLRTTAAFLLTCGLLLGLFALLVLGMQWTVEATCSACLPGMDSGRAALQELARLERRIAAAGALLIFSAVGLLVLWLLSVFRLLD